MSMIGRWTTWREDTYILMHRDIYKRLYLLMYLLGDVSSKQSTIPHRDMAYRRVQVVTWQKMRCTYSCQQRDVQRWVGATWLTWGGDRKRSLQRRPWIINLCRYHNVALKIFLLICDDVDMLVPVVEQESRRGVFTWLQFISSTPCASDTETQSKYEY